MATNDEETQRYFINDNLTKYWNSVDKTHQFRAETLSDECSQQTAAESRNLDRLKTLEETKHVRILCWVMTSPGNHESRAKHVKATWGKRCNILYFVSTAVTNTLPSIAYNATTESRSILWGKTKLGFIVTFDINFYFLVLCIKKSQICSPWLFLWK